MWCVFMKGAICRQECKEEDDKCNRISLRENRALGEALNSQDPTYMAVNEEGDTSVRIDIDRLESSIKDMMPHGSLMPPKCCIFRTPVILKRHNKNAYIPDAFSIGPFHHGCPNLKATEKIKAKYLQGLISRSYYPELLRTLITSIMEVEKEARECYAEAIDQHYSPEELVKILVIDGCFLIELFLRNTYKALREKDDPIFTRSCMIQFLRHDLMLLENQVPWMVLEILFKLTKHSYPDERPPVLIILVKDFLNNMFSPSEMRPQDQVINIKGIEHFVDLFRKLSILPSTDPQPPVQCINIKCIKPFVDLCRGLPTVPNTPVPSATSLVEAGIKFKKSTSQSIQGVNFNDCIGVLEIPPLVIQETTETVFRNLISYEQCHPNREDMITSYAVLLDSLINTAKDIEILCESKIIENWLNPEDAAKLFNKLYHDTYVNYCYIDLCKQVNIYCQRNCPKWRRVLMRNYFNTPWAILSTLAAVILLILTLVQTVYTVKK